jgi:hypothetical protein
MVSKGDALVPPDGMSEAGDIPDLPWTSPEGLFLAISRLSASFNRNAIWHIAMPMEGAVHCIKSGLFGTLRERF